MHAQIIEEIKINNTNVDQENRKLDNLKSRIGINVISEGREDNEVALIRLNNHREESTAHHSAPGISKQSTKVVTQTEVKEQPPVAEPEVAEEGQDHFSIEKVPHKIPLLKPDNSSAGPVIVYHSEAQYALRKVLIEQARKSFRELEKAQTNDLLNHSYQISKQLEIRFEEDLIKNMGYGKGHQHVDNNCRIMFRTFLKE